MHDANGSGSTAKLQAQITKVVVSPSQTGQEKLATDRFMHTIAINPYWF
jgi:hypothetical protein